MRGEVFGLRRGGAGFVTGISEEVGWGRGGLVVVVWFGKGGYRIPRVELFAGRVGRLDVLRGMMLGASDCHQR